MNKEDLKEEMKETVLVAVREAFAAKISEAERKDDPEEEDDDNKKVEESEDEESEDDKKVEESEDEEESDEDDDDDVVEESLKVKATKNGKERELEISNFKALVQLAKSGGYESFVVNDGKEEIEYAVSNGRLVEL